MARRRRRGRDPDFDHADFARPGGRIGDDAAPGVEIDEAEVGNVRVKGLPLHRSGVVFPEHVVRLFFDGSAVRDVEAVADMLPEAAAAALVDQPIAVSVQGAIHGCGIGPPTVVRLPDPGPVGEAETFGAVYGVPAHAQLLGDLGRGGQQFLLHEGRFLLFDGHAVMDLEQGIERGDEQAREGRGHQDFDQRHTGLRCSRLGHVRARSGNGVVKRSGMLREVAGISNNYRE